VSFAKEPSGKDGSKGLQTNKFFVRANSGGKCEHKGPMVPTSPPPPPPPPPPPVKATTMAATAAAADPRFAPFVKMLAVHVPAGAVRHKMAAEGLAEPDIQAFLAAHAGGLEGAGEAAPAPSPVPPIPPRASGHGLGIAEHPRASGGEAVAPDGPATADLLASIRRGVALKPTGPAPRDTGRPAPPTPAPAVPTMQSLLAKALGARRNDAHLVSGESAAFTRDDYSDA
jgi:hypothetical protein